MDRIYDICDGCDHFCLNNDDGFWRACRAFPGGIPMNEIGDINSHDKPLDYQKNDYVYTPAKKKVNRFGDEIDIYQDSNTYADENGIYRNYICSE